AAAVSGNTVKFNGTPALVDYAAPGELTAVVPIGASTGKISVTVGNQTAVSLTEFIIIPGKIPHIASFSPTIGKAGDYVLIKGSNFSTAPSLNTVKFNGIAATVTNS